MLALYYGLKCVQSHLQRRRIKISCDISTGWPSLKYPLFLVHIWESADNRRFLLQLQPQELKICSFHSNIQYNILNFKPEGDLFPSRLKQLCIQTFRSLCLKDRCLQNFLFSETLFGSPHKLYRLVPKFLSEERQIGLLVTRFWPGSRYSLSSDSQITDPTYLPESLLECPRQTRHHFHQMAWLISTIKKKGLSNSTQQALVQDISPGTLLS